MLSLKMIWINSNTVVILTALVYGCYREDLSLNSQDLGKYFFSSCQERGTKEKFRVFMSREESNLTPL